MADKVASWPKVTIRLYDDHNAEVKIAGRSHPVNHSDPRQAAIALVSERAAQLGRPVKATAVEADGASWPLIIHPDGQVEAVETESSGRGRGGGQKPIWPIIIAFVLAGVLIAGTTLYLTVFSKMGDGTPKATESPKLPELPGPSVEPDDFTARPVPQGWSTHADWTVDIAENTSPAVAPDGSEVAVLTPDNKIAVFDTNGKVLWQDKVPKDAKNPVYTTIDSHRVLAVATSDTLYYWAGDGAEATEVELPNSSQIQFSGTSPLIQLSNNAGASVVSGGELRTVPNQKRESTILLAEGDRALMARYRGPLYWGQPGKDLQTVALRAPRGTPGIDHVMSASPGLALVVWKTAKPGIVIPAVHSTADGSTLAVCPNARSSDVETWQWMPDAGRKVAAWGECMINFSTGTTSLYNDFRPVSITNTTIYGTVDGGLVATTPGGHARVLASNTARPWGIAGTHAIVVQDSVVYALTPEPS